MRIALSVVVLAACAAPAAQTRSTAPPGATEPIVEVSEENEPVCHEESVTGSNLTRTVCRTKSQEERDREDARNFNHKTGRIRQTLKEGGN